MKVIAINGSPRKKWNTAMLLEKAIEGAKSIGAETELVQLYDLNFKGCISCFACKIRGGKSYGKCAVKDDLTPIFERIEKADGIIMGSPIYFGAVSGEMRSFLERLLFPYGTYTLPRQSLFPGKIRGGFIYTMNLTEEQAEKLGYGIHLGVTENAFRMRVGECESFYCYDTWQFDDYSKVVADMFDQEKKAKRRKEIFPQELVKAFDMGARFAKTD
jgi:multimeric flavodoxin WrbA